jgi:hypothetical protein
VLAHGGPFDVASYNARLRHFLSQGAVAAKLRRSAQHVVFLEPGLHLIPSILGGFLAVAGAVVGVKAVRRARIDLEFGGLVGLCERSLQRLDIRDGNAGIGFAVQVGLFGQTGFGGSTGGP